MSFSKDRDLIAIEPAVFQDVPILAQQRVLVSDAAIDGVTLGSPSADFVSACVGAGSVVLINGVAHEVIDRVDTNTLTVSLPRTQSSGDAVPSGDGTGLTLEARTFQPQAEVVCSGLLKMIGIDQDDTAPPVTESAILSATLMAQLEALGTLELVYAGAASLMGDNDVVLMKMGEYRRRFRQMRDASTVLLDTDGDGHADQRVALGNITLSRA